jgi:hypothetical protein
VEVVCQWIRPIQDKRQERLRPSDRDCVRDETNEHYTAAAVLSM